MPYLLVDYIFDPPITDDELVAGSEALAPCLEVRGIRKLRSWVADSRTRGVCEYHAADAESLREAYRSANVKYATVWSATLFEPGELPDAG